MTSQSQQLWSPHLPHLSEAGSDPRGVPRVYSARDASMSSTCTLANNNNNHQNSPSLVSLPDGRVAMVVVDPLTRKLTIPCDSILETKAQMRHSIPSLCQLFLAGRCRQNHLCHQVHADPFVVTELRMQVDRLPICCVEHGDEDFTTGQQDRRCLRIPNLRWNGGLVPIRHISYTQGLQQILSSSATTLEQLQDKRIVLDLSQHHVTLCRLHVVDRCRFAEDCKFLHVCKEMMQADPSYFQSTTTSGSNSNTNNNETSHHHHHRSGGAAAAAAAPYFSSMMGGINNSFSYYQAQLQHSTTCGVMMTPPQHFSCTVLPPPSLSLVDVEQPTHTPTSDVEYGTRHATPPQSPEALSSLGEQSITSMMSGSFAAGGGGKSQTNSPAVGKKFRPDSSWSYDPYGGCAAASAAGGKTPPQSQSLMTVPPAPMMIHHY